MGNRRRLGATLLIVGGLAGLLQGLWLLAPGVLPWPDLVTGVVLLIPIILIAIACIVLSTSYRGRGRLGLLIAGAFGLLVVAVSASQTVLAYPFGPAPAFMAVGLSWIATLAAAGLLLSDRTMSGPARWAFAIPAACTLLQILNIYVLPWIGTFFLPSLGYIIAGYLLLRTADDPASRLDAPNVSATSPSVARIDE